MPSSKVFDENPDFKPSPDFLKFWLSTRKEKIGYAFDKFPGMFETVNYPIDCFLFSLALIGEFWGLINLMSVMNLSPFIKIGVVAGGILLDLLFATCAHWNQKKICRSENEIKLTQYGKLEPPTPKSQTVKQTVIGRIEDLEHDILMWKIWSWFFKVLIIVLAIIKISFFKANAPTGNSLVFPIIVTYIIVAAIHIYSTGYFGAETILQLVYSRPQLRKYRRQQGQYKASAEDIKGKNPEEALKFPTNHIITAFSLDKRELKQPNECYVPHEIKTSPENKTYNLITFGILTDSQLKNLVKHQGSKDSEKEIATEGLYRQWQQL